MWGGEHARYHLEQLGRPYLESDLLDIAYGQVMLEDEATRGVSRVVLCDTDMITIRIWSEEVFGRCAPELIALSEQRLYDHWLLCRPDIPWEPDPLRENPHDRDRLFLVYEAMLRKLGKPFTIVEGEREHRMAIAVRAVDALLG
jgi:nicotinamide riboside kinase